MAASVGRNALIADDDTSAIRVEHVVRDVEARRQAFVPCVDLQRQEFEQPAEEGVIFGHDIGQPPIASPDGETFPQRTHPIDHDQEKAEANQSHADNRPRRTE